VSFLHTGKRDSLFLSLSSTWLDVHQTVTKSFYIAAETTATLFPFRNNATVACAQQTSMQTLNFSVDLFFLLVGPARRVGNTKTITKKKDVSGTVHVRRAIQPF
jgi:hypothetical protein